MSMNEADGARGARMELAIDAALRGNPAMAIGMLAGMAADERDAFGPVIAAAITGPQQAGPHSLITTDIFGNAALASATASSADPGAGVDELSFPAWVNQ